MALKRERPLADERVLGRVRLWRDDLYEIVKVMREVAPDLTLHADDYTLDDVDDLADAPETYVRRFVAESQGKGIRLDLADVSVIAANDPDLKTRGMMEEVQRLTRRRRVFITRPAKAYSFAGVPITELLPPRPIVFTTTYAETPPWWVRNKDALATNFIVSLVFLGLGILIGHFLAK